MQSQSSDTFPSHNGNDQISFYDPAFYYTRPFFINDSESNPTSKQENNNNHHRDLHSVPPSLSLFHLPSPFEDTETFLEQHHDFLLQFHHHQPLPQDPEPQILPPCITTMDPSSCTKKGDNQIQRKRLCKRDRHSKIKTARGLRDRRMRLSLEVAKRFFGLQDMLGFDKASKTVEWLLNQAKVEINRLVKGKKKQQKKNKENDHHHYHSCGSASSPECNEEGVSSLDEVVVSGDQDQEQQERVEKVVKRRVRHSRKISGFHPLAKECRERARERARERTREKMRDRSGVLVEESKQCREDLIQLGSWNPFETREEFAHHTVLYPSSFLNVITTEAKEQSNHQAKEHGDDDDDSLVNYFEQMEPLLDFQ